MVATLVVEDQREHLVFNNCQVEADDTVVRKERHYETSKDVGKRRIGTTHHSIVCLTQRGSTRQCVYFCEPKFVPVADSGKPSPPALPSVALVKPLLSRHVGQHVVLHTDGAEAYASACRELQSEGYTVLHDHVVHSQKQWTAFGKHYVDQSWEGCDMVAKGPTGESRIRVIKGSQKAEGLWRHVKHSAYSIPEEVHNDDERLNLYVQTLVWRMQCVDCPYLETLRLCRAFRHLPLEKKQLVWNYHLKTSPGSKTVCLRKPPVTYCSWSCETSEEGDHGE